jgi:hypothetical protein
MDEDGMNESKKGQGAQTLYVTDSNRWRAGTNEGKRALIICGAFFSSTNLLAI